MRWAAGGSCVVHDITTHLSKNISVVGKRSGALSQAAVVLHFHATVGQPIHLKVDTPKLDLGVDVVVQLLIPDGLVGDVNNLVLITYSMVGPLEERKKILNIRKCAIYK